MRFLQIVEREFGFLPIYGFAKEEEAPTLARYRHGNVTLNVYCGRQSFEIGLELLYQGHSFSLGEIIRLSDPAAAAAYRNPVAFAFKGLEPAIAGVAERLRRYGVPALRAEPAFFAALRSQQLAWSKAYELEVLIEQTRPKAEAAFREGRYQDAARLYEKIEDSLNQVEQKKLEMSRKRS